MRKAILVVSVAALFIGSIGTLIPSHAQASDQPGVAALPGSAALCALALPEVLASTPVLIEPLAAKFGEKFELETAAFSGCLACARSCSDYCQPTGCDPVIECNPGGLPYCKCSCVC